MTFAYFWGEKSSCCKDEFQLYEHSVRNVNVRNIQTPHTHAYFLYFLKVLNDFHLLKSVAKLRGRQQRPSWFTPLNAYIIYNWAWGEPEIQASSPTEGEEAQACGPSLAASQDLYLQKGGIGNSVDNCCRYKMQVSQATS